MPAAAIAAAGFTDVADDSVFVADIQWMKDNDITRGCNPPANDRYCPSNNVTREQMSAFMHRLAVNQVVDAATAIQADHTTTADNATDADTLDGLDSTDFVPATALIPVATALIDLDPSSTTVKRGTGFTTRTHAKTGVMCLELDPALGIAGVQLEHRHRVSGVLARPLELLQQSRDRDQGVRHTLRTTHGCRFVRGDSVLLPRIRNDPDGGDS